MTQTEVETGGQLQTIVFQGETETTIALRIGVTEINYVVAVNLSVVVDVLIDGITALELVFA